MLFPNIFGELFVNFCDILGRFWVESVINKELHVIFAEFEMNSPR